MTSRVRALRLAAIAAAALQPLSSIAQPESFSLSDQQLARLGVALGTAERVERLEVAMAPGQVVVPPAQQALAAAPVAGSVARILVAEGDAVTAGQTLAELDSAELLELQHVFLDAEADDALAAAQAARDRALLADGIIAERRVEESRAAARAARATLDQARRRLELAGFDAAALERLAANRALETRIAIRAPIDGVVASVLAEVGARLDTLDPILSIADLETLWIELRLPQESASRVAPGMTVLAAAGRETVTGTVTMVGRVVDRVTQTVLVRAELAEPAAAVNAGQFLATRVLAEPASGEAYAIPAAAITRHGDRAFVFVRAGADFVAQPITVLAEAADRVYVTERLDEPIATEGIGALKALWLGQDEDS